MYFGREEKNVPNKSASSHCSKQQTMYIMLESSMYSESRENIPIQLCFPIFYPVILFSL